MDLSLGNIREALIQLILLVASLSLHEWGHAACADRMGDDLPRSQGRVTLNPLPHIDPIGTIVIPLLGLLGLLGSFGLIGWAKPVEINPAALRETWKRAMVTAAGPAVNFALALGGSIALGLSYRFAPSLADLLNLLVVLNVALVVFNLLPIPPLDGSKFLMYWFGMAEDTYYHFARYGSFVLLVLINIPAFRQLIGRLIAVATTPFGMLAGLIAG